MALDQCARWLADGLDLPVSVNLSPKNCVDTQLPDAVAGMLAARKLPPSVLRLEITEHAAVGAEAADVLGGIRRLGVSVALDDFGTGYSSLAYLRLLSVDDIKIDRTFVAALAQDPTDTVIIGSTIDMAHQLGCSVTAEGVEDEETLRTLALLGTDSVQGFHVCHPLPADELCRWLAGRAASVTTPASDARELRKR
jgi:EAL domain-containing protein (putative c-di-GMP-specific phosphodiesterase class I)